MNYTIIGNSGIDVIKKNHTPIYAVLVLHGFTLKQSFKMNLSMKVISNQRKRNNNNKKINKK